MHQNFPLGFTKQPSAARPQSRAIRRLGEFVVLMISLHQLAMAQARDALGVAKNAATSSTSAAQSQPSARPFLWEIDRTPPAFLFGTIHLADDQIQNLPPVVATALEVANAVITEIPIDEPAMLQEMGPRLLLSEGRLLSDVLPPALFERLEKYVASRGQSIAALERNKVWVVAAQVGILDLVRQVGTRDGLDLVIARKARALEKITGGLETASEQLDAFEELAFEDQVKSLDRLLSVLERQDREGRQVGRELLDGYRGGDEKQLAKLMDESLDPRDPSFARSYEVQITRRDRRMADRIDRALKENPERSYLFAIGAYHLIGPERNVITLLQDKGWRIRRLSPNDAEVIRAKTNSNSADIRQGIPTSKRVDQKQGDDK